VITKPRAPHHKGSVPVLELAESNNIPTLTAANKQELDKVITDNSFKSNLAILIDFGIIVSQKVIDSFPLGIVNSHFSLLPKLRGADPITFTILNGDEKTGVSLMLIDEGMDTGKLLTQKTYHLPNTITTPELTDELIALSHKLLCEYLPSYIDGKLQPRQQPHPDRATYTRKLTKTDGIIDWNKPAEQIEREIRAFLGWPGSRTTLFKKDVIITRAHVDPAINNVPGSVGVNKESGLITVSCGSGSICIEELKPAGKKEMPAKAFLSGLRLA
jgi:methionyl-tRNA formyltransferase